MHGSLPVSFANLAHILKNFLRGPAALAILASTFWSAPASAQGWPVGHGNPANTNYANVATAPATTPMQVVNDLGTFADGVSPVVSAQGNVFLGTREGRVIALRSNGARWWDYELGSGWVVGSTPALTSRGELFVLAGRLVTDHRNGSTEKRFESQILGFADGGALLFRVLLPARVHGGASTAPLNIVRDPAGQESVVFPMRYYYPPDYYQELWLLAYNRFGVMEAEVKVASEHGSIGIEQDFGVHFEIHGMPDPDALPDFKRPEFGAAVPHGEGLDPSIVVVNDGLGSVVRYRFTGRFAEGFTEIARWKQGGRDPAISTPAVALNGAVLFARPHDVLILQNDGTDQRRKVSGWGDTAPAVLPNGRIIHRGDVSQLQEAGSGAEPVQVWSGHVSPTATRNYVYAAGWETLTTHRIDDLSVVATFDWRQGGRQQPVIGPLGHVYALTFSTLYIFPPAPSVATGTNIGPAGTAGMATAPSGSSAGAAPSGPATDPEPGAAGANNAVIFRKPQKTLTLPGH